MTKLADFLVIDYQKICLRKLVGNAIGAAITTRTTLLLGIFSRKCARTHTHISYTTLLVEDLICVMCAHIWCPFALLLLYHREAITQQQCFGTSYSITVLYLEKNKGGWETEGRGKHTIKPLPKNGFGPPPTYDTIPPPPLFTQCHSPQIPLSEASKTGFGGGTL